MLSHRSVIHTANMRMSGIRGLRCAIRIIQRPGIRPNHYNYALPIASSNTPDNSREHLFSFHLNLFTTHNHEFPES